jgi:hypothetical protein
VFVGALSGDTLNLFQLDWSQVGKAVLGAAVLEAAARGCSPRAEWSATRARRP